MKLRDEHLRSYIDDIRALDLLNVLTWKGNDVAAAWFGAHEPATRSDDAALASLARMSRDHYLFYRALVEDCVEREGDVLDVGCGSGQRTAMLSRYAKHVAAIDSDAMKVSMAAVTNGNGRIDWVLADFMDWARNNSERVFDYVFAVELIEHVPLDEQEAFIEALIGKVAGGGALLMTTPRDTKPERRPPHIGLWDDDIAEGIMMRFGGEMRFFNVRALADGGHDPRCGRADATHYVAVIRK